MNKWLFPVASLKTKSEKTASYSRYNRKYRWQVEYCRGVYTGLSTEWQRIGIPANVLDWCEQHCEKEYGWHFTVETDEKIKKAIISFEDKDEAFWFSLKHSLNNNQ